MTAHLAPQRATELGERFGGRVMLPGQDGYDAARQVWNVIHSHRPALIAQPETAADVAAAVGFAAEHGLGVCVRGGGYNHAGYAVADGALMLDLSQMRAVRVDPARGVATVGGGATWGTVDTAAGQAGLAVTGSDISHVGVGGSTLGGGLGWLHRKLGLSCDNLRAAKVVTAGGRVLSVSVREHPELFWALRGGGGNFGVVTSFTFDLHPVGPVFVGTVIHPMDRVGQALALYQQLCNTGGDRLLTRATLAAAPPLPFIPERLHGKPVVVLSAAWFGPDSQAGSALRELRGFGPPAADLLRPMSYPELQRMQDTAVPRRVKATILGGFTGPLGTGVVEALAEAAAEPPPMAAVMLQPLGGAVARIPADATAFSYRHAAHYLAITTMASPADDGAEQAAWGANVQASLPAGTVFGPNVHALGRDEPEQRIHAAYGEKAYARLAAIKAAYDPGNVFRFNKNIRPLPAGPGQESSSDG
jgi:FAD/FMN-containing dehydrogenase